MYSGFQYNTCREQNVNPSSSALPRSKNVNPFHRKSRFSPLILA